MSTPDTVTVDLDPKVWARGAGTGIGLLDKSSSNRRKQCCIGVLLTQLGVPDNLLKNNWHAYSVCRIGISESAIRVINACDKGRLKGLYNINDDSTLEYISDEDRVVRLNIEAKKQQLPFRFRLVDNDPARRVSNG